ncbi:hypothetical protein [Rhizobium sp. RCAM05973]|uniref:hypothetical protein n=1 Tax=Rhizobium sp. RCAM05973 TaxID=2994066 RepID=UPI0022EBE8D5|nr:hypothetical protein [Rhizobium sp. RCAM05973]
MNIFQNIMTDQAEAERSLGNPLDPDARERRLTLFAQVTGGKGFRIPATSSNGKRAAKKAAAADCAYRQFRKEREIGTDPIFHHGQFIDRNGASDKWKRLSKSWDEANV